jgi:dTDP-4-dehydrorhamnose 3,5-epimerase
LDGNVLDVVVDIRKKSPNYGKYISVNLSSENNYQLWIPPGFAHGFVVLSDYAKFFYKVTNYYSPNHEKVILWNDKDLNIDWASLNPILSKKDIDNALSFKEFSLL